MIFPKSWHKQIKGQAMVETAFVLFILVLFAFGITEFGRAMYTKNTLNNAARAGARQAVVTPGMINVTAPGFQLSTACSSYTCPPGAGDPVNGCIYQTICNSLFNGINRSQVHVTISGGTGSGSKAVTGDTITATVTYGTPGTATGFQSAVPKLIPIGNVLIGTASMRYE
jgi:TadE-like protein